MREEIINNVFIDKVVNFSRGKRSFTKYVRDRRKIGTVQKIILIIALQIARTEDRSLEYYKEL